MMNHRCIAYVVLIILSVATLTACGGTFEVGVEISSTPSIMTITPATAIAALTFAPTAAPTTNGTFVESATTQVSATTSLSATPEPPTQPIVLPSATPAPCKPPLGWVAYTVKSGDTLFEISQRTNVTVSRLQNANCLTGNNIRIGQQLFVPFIPTPTFTFTPLPTSTWTPEAQGLFAPGGKRYATDLGLVVDLEQGKTATVTTERSPWLRFWRWTADGRFAVFTRINQYGNGRMMVFDAQAWKVILETPGCASPMSLCGEYPIALYAFGPRFLRADGWLTDLPNQQTDLLAPWRAASLFVVYADWSPNGASLAFAAGSEAQNDFALYWSQGDGAQVQRTLLDGIPQSLQWTTDNKTVVVMTSLNRYTLDVTTGQLQETAMATVTPTPSPSATSTLTLTPTP